MKNLISIAETPNHIVLDEYVKINQTNTTYQTEADLENELIKDLIAQGYKYRTDIDTKEKMLENIRTQIQILNDVEFTDSEWKQFCDDYLDASSDTHADRAKKIHEDWQYHFTFSNGQSKNISIVDKKAIARNKLQIISQFEQEGTHLNRYDVTVLVNGLPLVQIELKKRGIAIREAFNQVHRYSKESFNSNNSLFKYLQIFVISNGTDTRYFANTIKRNKKSFDFTMHWAKFNNEPICDIKDFTATFLQTHTVLKMLLCYSIFDTNKDLIIMRPYQVAATERILWQIKCANELKKQSSTEGGGYIWHTTGSGKTITSFKTARLATDIDFIDKVFFVVDRKDLDDQTIEEYQRFSPDSVNRSENTAGLKENIEKDDNKIIVTTIQKLNNLMKSEPNLSIYNKQVVFIFDEAHRSQFGEAQINLRKKFKYYYQFGFTGTPIFTENALGAKTTKSVFGEQLHSYVITDAIRDGKVLKFKVDYNNVCAKFKDLEAFNDDKTQIVETEEALLHHERVKSVSQYILDNFRTKTGRTHINAKGFNAMFAVSSIEAAKCYYNALTELQKNSDNPLKIATIFSFAANEEQNVVGEIVDENFEPAIMNTTAKEFLSGAIDDYNTMFKTSYSIDGKQFQNYYRDLAKRVKHQEVDLLIVVGMFLTGFDAQTLNTLFVDKNLQYHGLIQAFSRTNRIYDDTKTFGNIITFRDLEQSVIAAISLFGNSDADGVILEKSYSEYMWGFSDASGNWHRGYLDVAQELTNKYPTVDLIVTDKDKHSFSGLFGNYLRLEHILQNYDEFTRLKEIEDVNIRDVHSVDIFKDAHNLNDSEFKALSVLTERAVQDYRATYMDVRIWLYHQKKAEELSEAEEIDWDSIVFEVDLISSQEINLDYILELIFNEHKKQGKNDDFREYAKSLIRSRASDKAKEKLILNFITHTKWSIDDRIEDILEQFYKFAQAEQKQNAKALIQSEAFPDVSEAKKYISMVLSNGSVDKSGLDLGNILPKKSRFGNDYKDIRDRVFDKINNFVEEFKGIGGIDKMWNEEGED